MPTAAVVLAELKFSEVQRKATPGCSPPSKRAAHDLLKGRGLDLSIDEGAIIRQPELEYGAFGFQDI